MGLHEISEMISGIRGADYADLYAAKMVSHNVRYDDGRMDTLSSSRGSGLGIRLIIGGNSVYAHTIGTKISDAGAAARQAADMSGLAIPDVSGKGDLMPETNLSLPVLDAGFLGNLDRSLRADCKYVKQVTFSYSTSCKAILIVKGDGSLSRDERVYTAFRVHIVLEKDGAVETGFEARSRTCGLDTFWNSDGATPESVTMAALARGLLLLDAKPCPAGTMTVLLDGKSGGAMIHEACGHGLEADIVEKDYSAFRDKMGERVADPIVTIIDDATLPDRWGSYAYDDEGTPGARNVLVENGVLKMYMTDILSARRGDLPVTGNGRRQSYGDLPIPRMSNTFVTPGETAFEDMLDSMERGLLVKKMGGGEVNPTSGDFVFQVTEGYLVERGHIGQAVKGATLAGNGPEVLWNIEAIGRELSLDPGTCGKSGQGVPVTDGQPSILIKNLIVGGPEA
ncbi:MAG: TldD/PmbA family protein [Synergistaceae bacterium]|nr:TldD/PmbA family protein [Synergistaceae bacterium]